MEVDDAVPQEVSAEIQSPKREVIRVESGNQPGRSRGNGLRAKRIW